MLPPPTPPPAFSPSELVAVKVFVYTEGGEEQGLRLVKALLGHLPLFLELDSWSFNLPWRNTRDQLLNCYVGGY